ncbi:hypothetical protein [Spirosoma sp.]|uniref:hypothetical protein n=1 Tax=Spirosoma sp. TaxID=1899569 RepID=UPI003B3A90C6
MSVVKLPSLKTGDAANETFFGALADAVNGKPNAKVLPVSINIGTSMQAQHNFGQVMGWSTNQFRLMAQLIDSQGFQVASFKVEHYSADIAILTLAESVPTPFAGEIFLVGILL